MPDERLADAAGASAPEAEKKPTKGLSADAKNGLYKRLGIKPSTPFKRIDAKTGRTFTVSVNRHLAKVTKDAVEDAAEKDGGKASTPADVDDKFAEADSAKNVLPIKAGTPAGGAALLNFIGAMSDEQFQKRAEAALSAPAK